MFSSFDPQRVSVPAGPLPRIDVDALRSVGVELPVLLGTTAKLSGGKGASGVFHRPRSSPGPCRHASRAAGLSRDVVIAEVYDRICPACRLLPLSPVVRTLWQAAAQVSTLLAALADAEHLAHAKAAMPYLSFARLRALTGDRDDQLVHAWSAIAASHPHYRADAKAATAAWARARARHRELLEWLADTCPPLASAGAALDAAGSLGAATDVSAGGERTVSSVSRRLARAAGLAVEPWAVAASAWAAARDRDGDPQEARASALAAVAEQLDGARVVDVRALPAPQLEGARFSSPADWADAELGRWWRQAVEGWCQQLEEALRDAGGGAEEEVLVSVLTWPLTLDHDADLAHLSLVEPLAVVPYGARAGGRANFAAVLALPADVAGRAVRLGAGRVVPDLGVGGGDLVSRAVELARELFPYRPADADSDTATAPSAAVEEARAHHGDRPLWAPNGRGCRTDGLVEAVAGLDRDQVLALTLECGARDEAFLATVTGTVAAVDPVDDLVLFTPWGGHDALPVPAHRLVALAPFVAPRGASVPVWLPVSRPAADGDRYGQPGGAPSRIHPIE
ncbi:hypothetical protein ACFY4B_27080 [Kitasatospora sp. NPDC001261]|uniref:hypothetical protein n=1 Tax=Kitasatospora sp. NPDC001261 TaxID=3364012 RepID=UPI00367B515F